MTEHGQSFGQGTPESIRCEHKQPSKRLIFATLIASGISVGLISAACGNSERGEQKTPTVNASTVQPTEISLPTVEGSRNVIEVTRENYLNLIESSQYEFRELLTDIDVPGNNQHFLRRFPLPLGDGGGGERGVNIEKIEKATGQVVEVYEDLNLFLEEEVLPITSSEAALVRVFAEDEFTVWGTSESEYADDNEAYEGIRTMRATDGECRFIDYGIARHTGEMFISVSSSIGDLVGENCQQR